MLRGRLLDATAEKKLLARVRQDAHRHRLNGAHGKAAVKQPPQQPNIEKRSAREKAARQDAYRHRAGTPAQDKAARGRNLPCSPVFSGESCRRPCPPPAHKSAFGGCRDHDHGCSNCQLGPERRNVALDFFALKPLPSNILLTTDVVPDCFFFAARVSAPHEPRPLGRNQTESNPRPDACRASK